MPHVNYIGPNGERWPSATELTRLLPQDWLWAWYKREVQAHGWRGWQKCKAISDRAMRLGTHVHALVEANLTGKPYTAWLNEAKGILEPKRRLEALKAMAEALTDTTARHTVQHIEKKVIDRELGLHGTVDVVSIDDEVNLPFPKDWKTSSSIDIGYAIQLAIYNRCLEAEGIKTAGFGEIERVDKKPKSKKSIESGIPHVQVKRFENLAQYYPVIDALHTIWKLVNKVGPFQEK